MILPERWRGAAALVAGALIWGLSPLYYKLLDHIPPLEVLAHRTLWSALLFVALLAARRRLADLAAAVATPRRLLLVIVAAAMISINWFMFIWAIQNARAAEASLGYYIFPLVSALLGVLVLRERPGRATVAALALAAAGVAVLTVGTGALPWIALLLALSFGSYGLIKAFGTVRPTVSVTAEVLTVAPLGAVYLALLYRFQAPPGIGDLALLFLAGPMTAIPMILFSYGARRVSLTGTGLIQYLNPTLQFFVAVVIFAEPATLWHALALPLIWAGLAVFTWDAIRQEKSARRASITASTESTVS